MKTSTIRIQTLPYVRRPWKNSVVQREEPMQFCTWSKTLIIVGASVRMWEIVVVIATTRKPSRAFLQQYVIFQSINVVDGS